MKKKWCCTDFEDYFPHDIELNKDKQFFLITIRGEIIYIDYCPFCGKKLEAPSLADKEE